MSIFEFSANDDEKCKWFGRRVDGQDRGVKYRMPGVRFGFKFTGVTKIDLLINFGGNFFNIFLAPTTGRVDEYTLCPSDSGLHWSIVAANLHPDKEYVIVITKKTEPEMKGILSKFSDVFIEKIRLHGPSPNVIPGTHPKDLFYPNGWIEVIGDSDVCGFGVDGEISGTSNIFSMDGEAQDCDKGWGSILAKNLLGKNSYTCVGWSGKGILSNAPMCGSQVISDLWLTDHAIVSEPPRLVAILAGGNDFYGGTIPPKGKFVMTFLNLISSIRKIRGKQVPIVMFQCGPGCASSAGSPSSHPIEDDENISTCEKLDEYMRLIRDASGGEKNGIFYHQINDLILEIPTDYAIMMHWSVSGQNKIASSMAKFILGKQLLG